MIIEILLITILIAVAIIGHNQDHYQATLLDATDFLELYKQLEKPPVFRKKIFFRSYFVIIHQGLKVGTLACKIDANELENIYTSKN